jgi:tetratricopeptide (TPR) repeat protein
LAHYFRAAAFYHLGALDEAADEVRIAVEINPERSIERVRTEGVIAFLKGEFQRAYALLGEVHRRSSGRVADFYFGEATFYVGDTTAAEKVLDELAHTPSASATARGRAALAAVLAARGARAESRRLLEAVSAPGYMDHHVAYAIGTAYAQLGDPAEARQWLARAADTGFPCYPWFQIDPLLAPLRADPEFRRWLEGVRLAWEEMIQSLGPSAERSTRGSAVPPRSTRGP